MISKQICFSWLFLRPPFEWIPFERFFNCCLTWGRTQKRESQNFENHRTHIVCFGFWQSMDSRTQRKFELFLAVFQTYLLNSFCIHLGPLFVSICKGKPSHHNRHRKRHRFGRVHNPCTRDPEWSLDPGEIVPGHPPDTLCFPMTLPRPAPDTLSHTLFITIQSSTLYFSCTCTPNISR